MRHPRTTPSRTEQNRTDAVLCHRHLFPLIYKNNPPYSKCSLMSPKDAVFVKQKKRTAPFYRRVATGSNDSTLSQNMDTRKCI